MIDIDTSLAKYQEVETGEAFTLQGPRLLKIELAEASVMAKNGAMVAYQGEVRFEHKGGGLGALPEKGSDGRVAAADAGRGHRRAVPRAPSDARPRATSH